MNLETVTSNLSKATDSGTASLTDVQRLLKASRKPKSLFIKFAEEKTASGRTILGGRGWPLARDKVIAWVNGLGVIRKLGRVSPADYAEV